jgi:exopolysaccharide/PEP-CTERM locus tyrosine autokinase
MSIVEKALAKIREGPRPDSTRAGAAELVFGALAPVDTHRVPQPGQTDQATSSAARRIVIDQDGLRAAGLLPPAHQDREIAEQYRQIKRPLIANATGRGTTALTNAHVIMMASALPGEGKTFTAINLGFSMAREKDISVLLVDADSPKPHISKLLGAAESPGLLDLLQNEHLDVESVILPTDVPGLSLLPSGKHNEQATELLASERMRALMTRLAQSSSRRMVLLDSPPLLLTTEARALAAVAGQVVLVVRAAHTDQKTVLDALSYLEGRSVALVLNQNMSAAPTAYYGYAETAKAQTKSRN